MASSEDIYKYDRAQQQSMLAAKPWEKDPHFFRVSLVVAKLNLKLKCAHNLIAFSSGHQDLCFGTAQDGDARQVGGKPRGHGTPAGKGEKRRKKVHR